MKYNKARMQSVNCQAQIGTQQYSVKGQQKKPWDKSTKNAQTIKNVKDDRRSNNTTQEYKGKNE